MKVFPCEVGESFEQATFFLSVYTRCLFLLFFRDITGVEGTPLVGQVFVEELLELISFGELDLHSLENEDNLHPHIDFRQLAVKYWLPHCRLVNRPRLLIDHLKQLSLLHVQVKGLLKFLAAHFFHFGRDIINLVVYFGFSRWSLYY